MHGFSRSQSALSILLIAIMALLAACGGNNEPATAPVPPTTTLVPPQLAATTTPVQAPPESPVQPISPAPQPESPLMQNPSSVSQAVDQEVADTESAIISGLLYSYGNEPIPGTAFYLTPAIQDGDRYMIPTLYVGPKAENGDVAGQTEMNGQFTLTDVPPGVYYLAVFAPYNWILAFADENATLPQQITVEAGMRVDLGPLFVPWP